MRLNFRGLEIQVAILKRALVHLFHCYWTGINTVFGSIKYIICHSLVSAGGRTSIYFEAET